MFSILLFPNGNFNSYNLVLTQPLYINLIWEAHGVFSSHAQPKESHQHSMGITVQSVLVALTKQDFELLLLRKGVMQRTHAQIVAIAAPSNNTN